MVGRVPLAHAIGVRVPVPQQKNLNIFYFGNKLYNMNKIKFFINLFYKKWNKIKKIYLLNY